MITKEATYKIAFENIKNRLKEKQHAHNMLLAAAYSADPRLSEIDRELNAIGSQLAIAALSGGGKQVNKIKEISKALSNEKKLLLEKAEVKEIEFDCKICNDTGFVSGKICDCVKREAALVLVKQLSQEMPLEDCLFENFDLKYYPNKADENGQNPRRRMTAILKLCKEYAIHFNPETSKNLLFMGNAGLGKTHLTLSIVSGVINKGFLPVYASAENLFTKIEAERFSGEGRGTYEAVLNCDLLVIDDLGAEMSTQFTKSVLYNIVNTRILTRKPTIINTNLTMKQLEERYTPRVSSRLIGHYEGQRFLGNDIRQQKLFDQQ